MAWPEKDKIRHGAASMLEVNLAVESGEKVLMMTDTPRLHQWRHLDLGKLQAALERSVLAGMVADLAIELVPDAEIAFLAYPAVERHDAEIGPETSEKIRAADVIIASSNCSFTHTMAAREASEAGARVAESGAQTGVILGHYRWPRSPMSLRSLRRSLNYSIESNTIEGG